MSAVVAYQSHVLRVSPVVAVSPVRSDDASASGSAPASASTITTRGSAAASALLALLGRTGLSGPDGTTVQDTTTAAPAGTREKLQQALTTLLDALKGSRSTASTEDKSAAPPNVDDAIQTILGALAPVTPTATAATTAATDNTDAGGQAVEAPAQKPNLDALNRVLAHYTAQSAAASSIVMLVR